VGPHADAGSDQRWRWQLGPFLIFQVVGLSEVKPPKDYADVISGLLIEFDQCF